MTLRTCLKSTVLVAALMTASAAAAVPVYTTADAVLPGGLGTLQTARSNAITSFGNAVSTEGLNSGISGNSVALTDFTMSLSSGNFGQGSGNNLVQTEGSGYASFGIPNTLTFSFNSAINFFAIDITSIDFSGTTVSFFDNLGNTLNNFGAAPSFAAATFFAVANDVAFSTVSFSFGSRETIAIDNVQYGTSVAPVPLPASLPLLGAGIVAVGALRRRKARAA